MNRKLCQYHKQKGTWNHSMCAICSYYNRCISRQEDEQKHDERRELAKQGVSDD